MLCVQVWFWTEMVMRWKIDVRSKVQGVGSENPNPRSSFRQKWWVSGARGESQDFIAHNSRRSDSFQVIHRIDRAVMTLLGRAQEATSTVPIYK